MYDWLSTVNDKFWLILNYSKVVWDIDTKFLPVVVLISFQLSINFGASSYTQNGFPAKTILKFKRAWRTHFLRHTHETQEICCFLEYVQIILVTIIFWFILLFKSFKKCWSLPLQVFRAPWVRQALDVRQNFWEIRNYIRTKNLQLLAALSPLVPTEGHTDVNSENVI